MAELKPLPCPICGAKLKKKITMRWKETVFDHPMNGCQNESTRVRGYRETIEAWNRRAGEQDG